MGDEIAKWSKSSISNLYILKVRIELNDNQLELQYYDFGASQTCNKDYIMDMHLCKSQIPYM